MAAKRTAVIVRSAAGNSSVEWFLIFAIITILVTRAYLAMTGWPQIGGGNLHIAHALWGGALMMLALVTGWMFLGSTARGAAILLGGIGFGLFLDEVGKFVTKDNDYFYGPSAEIMYVLVVLILLIGRVVRDVKKPTAAEAVANAAAIAADGIAHGLTARRRARAEQLIDDARAADVDPEILTHIHALLARGVDTPDRLMALRRRGARLIPRQLRSPRLLTVCIWLLAIGSIVTVAVGLLSRVLNHAHFTHVDLYFELSHNAHAAWILFISGVITAALTLPAMVMRNRTTSRWPLQALRLAALVYVMSNALVDFALEGFGALVNLAVGLFILAVINYHLGVIETRDAVHLETPPQPEGGLSDHDAR